MLVRWRLAWPLRKATNSNRNPRLPHPASQQLGVEGGRALLPQAVAGMTLPGEVEGVSALLRGRPRPREERVTRTRRA